MNNTTKTIIIFISSILLVFFIYDQRYIFTTPDCVDVVGFNEVVVKDAEIGVTLSGCDVTKINSYLEQNNFSRVGTVNITDAKYVR